jgi:hypothetical protein
MVSQDIFSLWILETIVLHSFLLSEKPNRKNNANIKDRTNDSLTTILLVGEKSKLKHVINRLNFFVDYHNKELCLN